MPPTPDPPPPAARDRTPLWRLAWPAWALAVVFTAAGVPLFLRMPPWCDLTLYDLAARNVLHGGVHYRDVFDTNLPGFVWLLAGVRAAFGWSTEAVRAVDLAIVAGIVWLLARFARRAGAAPAAVAWMVAGAAFFYPFTTEFNHAQRDVWMLLPALVATLLRLRRIDRGVAFGPAVLEGAIWGIAVWIKPHVAFPAAAVWLASYRRLVGPDPRPWPAARRDLLGNIAGGLVVGAAGVIWLVATGTWKPFVEVFQKWNGAYTRFMFLLFWPRVKEELFYFPPLNLFLPVGWVLAARNLWKPPADDAAFARRVLAALFLAWSAQALFVQRQFPYVHVPEMLLLLAVAAANGWALVPLTLAYAVVTGGLWLAADRYRPLGEWLHATTPSWMKWEDQLGPFPRHPLFVPDRTARWPDCFRTGLPDREYRERMNALALFPDTFPSVDAVQIGEVVAELRRLGAREGEVLCWHDSPHAAYLELGHRPPFRFMHVSTAFIGVEQYERMKIELIKVLQDHRPPIRYVVSDLIRVYAGAPPRFKFRMGGAGEDLLPPTLPDDHRKTFPLDRRAIFRSGGGHGRYLIHVYDQTKPFGANDDCYVAAWPEE